MKVSILVYIINPYNIEKPPRLFIKQGVKKIQEVSFVDLCRLESVLVSYHVDDLFASISRCEYRAMKGIIDITQAFKLVHGKQYKGKEGNEPWNIWQMMNKRYGSEAYVDELWKLMYTKEIEISERALKNRLNKFSDLILKTWKSVEKELKKGIEYDRYFNVEKPVNEVFLEQSFKGIRVNQQAVLNRLDRLDQKISEADRSLRKDYGVRDLNSVSEIKRILLNSGLNHAAQNNMKNLYNNILDFYSYHNNLARLLKEYRDNSRDKRIILRLGAINTDRLYPKYKILGTITGRIIVESPSLQYVRRMNRDIVQPDEGKVFLYPDYSQFEPGIMADDSRDERLINDFNSGDLYSSLSDALFKKKGFRDSAKILFLAFCYGMSLERMIDFASESAGLRKSRVASVLNEFFGKYEKLLIWRNNLEKELLAKKRIGTRNGNYRYRTFRSKSLKDSEKRWVISQRIQGTASLILKNTILDINRTFFDVDILLPMHDALLLQVPIEREQEYKVAIHEIFINHFKCLCPTVKPRVSFKPFFNEEDE